MFSLRRCETVAPCQQSARAREREIAVKHLSLFWLVSRGGSIVGAAFDLAISATHRTACSHYRYKVTPTARPEPFLLSSDGGPDSHFTYTTRHFRSPLFALCSFVFCSVTKLLKIIIKKPPKKNRFFLTDSNRLLLMETSLRRYKCNEDEQNSLRAL